MGIKTSVAALLVRAKEHGASFTATATIGRQSLKVPRLDLAALSRRLHLTEPEWRTFAADGYCEDFLRHFLGAHQVTSFDASGYQGASVVHDFNAPISEAFVGAFDAVIDGGTIEHIFDVRQVLANYMSLIRIGGGVFICTNANNLCGHGFYQFSPEFFHRVFSEANGFQIESMCMIETPFHFVEISADQRVFAVADPRKVGKRMVISTGKPVSIYVHARKIAERPLFAEPPYQSDYRARWTRHASSAEPAGAQIEVRSGEGFRYVTPWQAARRKLRMWRKNSLRNRRWFTPLVP